MKLRKFLAATLTVLSITAVMAVPPVTQAQNNVVLFGSGSDNVLGYKVRSKRPGARQNTYTFFAKLPKKAVAELQISYPDKFRGIFNPDNVTIRNRFSGKKYEVRETILDRNSNSIRFVFQEPIASAVGQEVELEILVQDVVNPDSSGMYQVEAQALGTEANPLFQYLGKWLVSIY